MLSATRVTLEKARYFLRQAAMCGVADRAGLATNLEAAIVFGRSTTFHLQKEYRHHPEFAPWYAEQQRLMDADTRCRFFKEARNLILKQGPVAVQRVISVELVVSADFAVRVAAQANRAAPWYRRPIRILWEDIRAELRRALGSLVQRIRRAVKERWRPPHPRVTVVGDDFFFDDPEWRNCPAVQLVGEYLDRLEPLIAGAEARFEERRA